VTNFVQGLYFFLTLYTHLLLIRISLGAKFALINLIPKLFLKLGVHMQKILVFFMLAFATDVFSCPDGYIPAGGAPDRIFYAEGNRSIDDSEVILMNQHDAKAFCESNEARLPTYEESIQVIYDYIGAFGRGYNIWTSSEMSRNRGIFIGPHSTPNHFDVTDSTTEHRVLCISTRWVYRSCVLE
jgi:hypothetical protein